MLSALRGLFSTNNPPPAAVQSFPSEQYVIGNLVELQNGLILVLGYLGDGLQSKKDKLNLCLYDPKSGQKIKERTIDWDESSRTVKVLSPELFVLYDSYSDFKMINARTLSDEGVISRKPLQESYDCLPMNSHQFMTLTPNGKERYILFHDYQTKQFNKTITPPIMVEKKAYSLGGGDGYNCCHSANLRRLGEDQFAFSISGHNTGYFKVFLFKQNPDEQNKLIYTGTISPKPAPHNLNLTSWGYGEFVVLPRERILTFNTYFQYFELWEGTKRLDSWSWDQPAISNIAPLPDGEHLAMLESGRAVYLLNLKTKAMQPMDLGELKPWSLIVNAQGQAIIRACDEQHNTKILIVDVQRALLQEKARSRAEAKDEETLANSMPGCGIM